jgi:hypothetical protein
MITSLKPGESEVLMRVKEGKLDSSAASSMGKQGFGWLDRGASLGRVCSGVFGFARERRG